MSNTFIDNGTSTREEIIEALIDVYNMRQALEAHADWCEMSQENLLFAYKIATRDFDPYEELYDD